MPAQRVGNNAVAIRRFDVVGQDAAGAPEFVGHVALAQREAASYRATEPLNVVHMRPPLEHAGQCYVHSVGSASLTADEEQQIALFSDEVQSEYLAAEAGALGQYVISPHVAEVRSEDDTLVCSRFSCAGFVIEAYREAGINLMTLADEDLPLVSLDTLKTQYARFARLLDSARKREELGIPGVGPWRVVLAGYVMNALDRPESEIRSLPYGVREGDEFFPRR